MTLIENMDEKNITHALLDYDIISKLINQNVKLVMWYDIYYEKLPTYHELEDILAVCYKAITDIVCFINMYMTGFVVEEKIDVWRYPTCKSIYVYEEGNATPIMTYRLEA